MKNLIFAIASLFLTITCQAQVITVDDNGPADFNSIQLAIDSATDGDTVIVAPGTYTGPGNRDIDFLGKAITVRSSNPNDPNVVAATIIDCNGTQYNIHRGFYFHSGEDSNSVLNGFTITNGLEYDGGGIGCYRGSNPTINNCIIISNRASYGGGICCSGGSNPAITNCIIIGNRASLGGGICCGHRSNPTITNCTISNNTTPEGGCGDNGGAGIACRENSSPKIENCTISGNTAGAGAGMYNSSLSNPTLTNCTISGNTAGGGGAGMYNRWSNPTLTNCTFTGNSAAYGGGMYNDDESSPMLTNCTFSGNSSTYEGGGMYNDWDSRPMISNCTISSNLAEAEGGGIFCRGNSAPTLTNTILWFNEDSGDVVELAQIRGGSPEVIYSCIQDDDPNDVNVPFADGDNIDDDPMFVHNPDDGGDGWGEGDNDDFGDLHLQMGSPCIEAGEPYFWVRPNSVDIDGQPRVMGLSVDIGADEFEWITTVVTRPKGGEVWVSGSQHEINWISHRVEGMVDILFSEDNGGNWDFIDSNVSDTGNYIWQLPNKVDSNQCLISVVPSIPDANIICIESGVFTIKKSPKRKPAPPGQARKGIWRDTGLSEHYGPELGCVRWQFETDGPVSARASIGDNRVYVACEDGNLYSLNKNDGTLIWSYDANSPLVSSPTLGYYGMVYVGSQDGKLHAINKGGELLWTHTTDGPIYSSAVVSPDGTIYISSLDGALHSLEHDGSKLWSFETGGFGAVRGSIFARPAIGTDGTIYIAGLYDPNLYALDPNDGSVKWACSFIDPCDPNSRAGWPFVSPVVAEDGTIYQTLLNNPRRLINEVYHPYHQGLWYEGFWYDSRLYAIDPNNGNIIWSTNMTDTAAGWFEPHYAKGRHRPYPHEPVDGDGEQDAFGGRPGIIRYYLVSNSSWSEPALGPDGTIYVSFDDAYLRAVDPNGSIKWVTRLGMMGGFTLTVGSDGLIYAASDDSHLYVVSPDGEEIARFKGYDWLSFPVIAADNTIIVSDANNIVWAIGGNGCEGQPANPHRPQDLNSDWAVDLRDFALLAADWLGCTDKESYPLNVPAACEDPGDELYFTGDVDRSFYVDLNDLAIIVEWWLSED